MQAGIGVIIVYEPNSEIAIEKVVVGGPADQQCPGKVWSFLLRFSNERLIDACRFSRGMFLSLWTERELKD
jgi:hypothetical protein